MVKNEGNFPSDLVVSNSGEVFYRDDGLVFSFDGQYHVLDTSGWKTLRLKHPLEGVEAWLRDPGKYSDAHRVVCSVLTTSGIYIAGGGSFAFVVDKFKEAHIKAIKMIALFVDRQLARDWAPVKW